MPIPIDAPAREPRQRATALTSYLPLDTTIPGDTWPNRWMSEGVSFEPWGCDLTLQAIDVDICADDAAEDAPITFEDSVTFPPFAWQVSIAAPARCRTADELRKHLDVLVQSEVSAIIAEQTMSGVWNAAAPTLEAEATNVSQSASAGPLEALAAVEGGLADVWRDSIGMIHVSPAILVQIKGALDFFDGKFHTVSGHIVVGDSGYQGGAPTSGTVVTGNSYIYGSSPVHYKYETLTMNGMDFENFDFTNDVQTVRVDGIAVVAFEPCSVVAARADFTP